MSAQEAFRIYQQRWPIKVDNFCLKVALGLEDFRLQSFEAIQKWLQVISLALNYQQYQQAPNYHNSDYLCSLVDIIRQHRRQHAKQVLRTVAEEVLRLGEVEPILSRFVSFEHCVT